MCVFQCSTVLLTLVFMQIREEKSRQFASDLFTSQSTKCLGSLHQTLSSSYWENSLDRFPLRVYPNSLRRIGASHLHMSRIRPLLAVNGMKNIVNVERCYSRLKIYVSVSWREMTDPANWTFCAKMQTFFFITTEISVKTKMSYVLKREIHFNLTRTMRLVIQHKFWF
jgi:hypothetical protein